MKFKIYFCARQFFAAVVFASFAVVSIQAQEFKTIRDGVEYAEMTREIDKLPVRMNLLRLDLTKVRLDVAHALDTAIGLEKTSSIATRYGAIAAVNAGFFRIDRSIYEGDETGVLQIDGKLLSESYGDRIALFINNSARQTVIGINHLNLFGTVYIDKKTFDSIGINRERKASDLVVFTPEFHRTTLTDASGLEIVVRNGKIAHIFDGKGSAAIPPDGFIVSASGTRRAEILARAKLGAKASFQFVQADFGGGLTNNHEDFAPASHRSEDIVGGAPQLVLNGKIEIPWQREKQSKAFVETKHPRTAVGKLKDGKFLMITIDGRSESSGGIALTDLAALFVEMGAIDAMNLDGGGSTTMFLDGKVVNHPSDKEGERKIGDAILVFPR